MASINDSLSPDLLFNIFKRLDCIETTIVRRVCKQWWEIIEIHKSFWRILHLPEKSLEWDPSILGLFDQKSGSTLHEVEVRVPVEDELQEQFFNTLKKSKESLRHLFVEFESMSDRHWPDFLGTCLDLESLIVIHPGWKQSCKVRLRRRRDSPLVEDNQNYASPLKVLWYDSNRRILQVSSTRFQNLASLDAGDKLSASEWRRFLEGPSRTLKHLRIGFDNMDDQSHKGITKLSFPNLEVLELDNDGDYPQWVKIKSSVKLICHGTVSNLPSILELWITEAGEEFELTIRCPELKTIRVFVSDYGSDDLGPLVLMINQRSNNVKDGIEVNGIQLGNVKTVIFPFDFLDTELVEKLKNLVEVVVDGDSLPQFLEVEI